MKCTYCGAKITTQAEKHNNPKLPVGIYYGSDGKKDWYACPDCHEREREA